MPRAAASKIEWYKGGQNGRNSPTQSVRSKSSKSSVGRVGSLKSYINSDYARDGPDNNGLRYGVTEYRRGDKVEVFWQRTQMWEEASVLRKCPDEMLVTVARDGGEVDVPYTRVRPLKRDSISEASYKQNNPKLGPRSSWPSLRSWGKDHVISWLSELTLPGFDKYRNRCIQAVNRRGVVGRDLEDLALGKDHWVDAELRIYDKHIRRQLLRELRDLSAGSLGPDGMGSPSISRRGSAISGSHHSKGFHEEAGGGRRGSKSSNNNLQPRNSLQRHVEATTEAFDEMAQTQEELRDDLREAENENQKLKAKIERMQRDHSDEIAQLRSEIAQAHRDRKAEVARLEKERRIEQRERTCPACPELRDDIHRLKQTIKDLQLDLERKDKAASSDRRSENNKPGEKRRTLATTITRIHTLEKELESEKRLQIMLAEVDEVDERRRSRANSRNTVKSAF